MKKVFVSGCYDILHAGHIQFFEDARALGDHLTVCFASDPVLWLAKSRKPAVPESHKAVLIGSLRCVDKVVKSSDLDAVIDFTEHIKAERPDILAVTEDDKNIAAKKKLCEEYGMQLVILPKRRDVEAASTTSILAGIKEIVELPLRVDFAGGWLDVPKMSRKGAFIVNCTITPKVGNMKKVADWAAPRHIACSRQRTAPKPSSTSASAGKTRQSSAKRAYVSGVRANGRYSMQNTIRIGLTAGC